MLTQSEIEAKFDEYWPRTHGKHSCWSDQDRRMARQSFVMGAYYAKEMMQFGSCDMFDESFGIPCDESPVAVELNPTGAETVVARVAE